MDSGFPFFVSDLRSAEVVEGVARALARVRLSLNWRPEVSEILDAFWFLQDQLGRVVDHAIDYPSEAFDTIRSAHPRLLAEIAELLSFTLKLNVSQIPAVNQSCATMNNSLQVLERLKYQAQAASAS